MEISHNIVAIFGLEIDLWVALMSLVVSLLLIIFAFLGTRKISWIPSGWQNAMEYGVEFIHGIIDGGMGERGYKYTYFFGSLFFYILISNMLGLIPGFNSPTKDISVNAALAVSWLIFAQYIAIRENGIGGYLKEFLEPFPPYIAIHLLEMGVRPLTLTMRLFANIMAGEIMLEKLTENFKVIAPSLWIAISILIGLIQAFIFTTLTVSYTGLSVSHEEEDHSSAEASFSGAK